MFLRGTTIRIFSRTPQATRKIRAVAGRARAPARARVRKSVIGLWFGLGLGHEGQYQVMLETIKGGFYPSVTELRRVVS